MQHAIAAYYAELQRYEGFDVTHETAVRSAMQTLLGEAGRDVGWTLVPEYRLPNGKRADGALVDPYRIPQGYWEAKATASGPHTVFTTESPRHRGRTQRRRGRQN